MKILPSLRYQLRDHRNAIIVYYGVMLAIVVLSLSSLAFNSPDSIIVVSGGITAATMIFMFILSLCAFKDSFRLNMQYGTSRRSQFLARLGAMGTVCAVLAAADELYTLLLALLGFAFPDRFFSSSLYEVLYHTSTDGNIRSVTTTTSSVFLSVVFSFFVLLAVSAFGYLISVFNYRLNKTGKIIFWVSWPALFIAASAFLDTHYTVAENFRLFILQVVHVVMDTLPRFCLTCTVLTVIFSALTWLFMRRAHIK